MPDGNPRKFLDSLLINSYGWKPSITLQNGLKDTYKWFLKIVLGCGRFSQLGFNRLLSINTFSFQLIYSRSQPCSQLVLKLVFGSHPSSFAFDGSPNK